MKAKTPILVVLIAAAAMLVAACGPLAAQAAAPGAPAQQEAQTPQRTLSVTGNGLVTLAPDVAYVTIGVHTQDLDAQVAVDTNSAQSQELIDALIAFGVAEADIQTTNFNIYSYEDYSQPYEGKPPLLYSVDNSVYVTVRDITTIGDLLSAAVSAGANNIWGIQFDVLDKAAAMSQARELAMEAARAQADELATLAGVELGEIVSISSYGGYPQPFAYGMGGGAAAETSAIAVPVSPGRMNISVDVSVVFSIQ